MHDYKPGDEVMVRDPQFGMYRCVVRKVNGPMLELRSTMGGPPIVKAYDRVMPIPAVDRLGELAS